MEKNLTFSGGLLLGAGLMYLFDPDRRRRTNGGPKGPLAHWTPGLQCVAGALGVAAFAYGARLLAQYGRKDTSTSTAFDTDMPNYAWLR